MRGRRKQATSNLSRSKPNVVRAYCNTRRISPICPSISASSSLTDAKSMSSSPSGSRDPTGEKRNPNGMKDQVPPAPSPQPGAPSQTPTKRRIEGAPTPMRVRLDSPGADREGPDPTPGVTAGGGGSGGGGSDRGGPAGAEARRGLASSS